MEVLDYFTSEVKNELKEVIKTAKGQEVYCIGRLTGEKEVIDEIEVVARGNKTAVPVPAAKLKPGEVVIHNHPSGNLSPSQPDLNLAAKFGAQSIGFIIVNNLVDELYVVVEPGLEPEVKEVPVSEISDIFATGNLLDNALPNYEYRYQQQTMAEVISKAFNRQTHLLVEAGTGTGKSLAYLIPSIYWATQNDQKVVVSTNTINLQEQLINKDIPFLKKTLDLDFKAVLVKGRRNYVCLRKVYSLQEIADQVFENKERDSYIQLLDWVQDAQTGCRSELVFQPEYSVWEKVASESDTCLRSNCSYHGECFFTKARMKSINADLLIVNHHLLFADIAVRKEEGMDLEVAVLPKYKHIVLDEAHNVEEVATNYLGKRISKQQLLKYLYDLHTKEAKKGIQGFLMEVRFRVNQARSEINKDRRLELQRLIDNILQPLVLKVTDRTNNFFNRLINFKKGLESEEEKENKLRLKDELTSQDSWREVVEETDNLLLSMNQLSRKLIGLQQELELLPQNAIDDYEGLLLDLNARVNRLKAMNKVIDAVINDSDDNVVNWIEINQNSKGEFRANLNSAPINIANEFRENLLIEIDSIIFTSATLTVDHSFAYIRERLGLEEDLVAELQTGDPFNYDEQAMLAIPLDMPEPYTKEFTTQALKVLKELLIANQGRSLVLFTSYGMLNTFYYKLKPQLEDTKINLYRQGEKSRHLLIQDFKDDLAPVIMGTDSFWEGIDIPGQKLSSVIIVKLPFQVPTDPIIEAKVEELESAGKNAFSNYMLPRAVIKFKQGFGRLIRSKSDSGAVVVLDKRIINKRYGKAFINSIPQGCQLVTENHKKIAKIINKF
ncbi:MULTISPECIES: helicase C-terminal domain-containing protein [unclassified Candidatus Frackibacter]|uniref:helicase C-terminal domain-containing protein n=1 Tax=unclassified Candidatus Frackibacter TaxID=2648818 RepID=UPI000883498D|nr:MULTISPECIES: helicase C-terminal domain-containing protein [unclassified Candidatus Frackibacter]SDB98385.1 ATP-dependent DNA helicase DinG [Candidatus Frackibacter sp. WG11]SEM30146.1 ATP-dependent DNA helicase DinG [Candidatus Frackibacter sp. WG12]SFL35100.1 ATP-dependent DNA helicase DinG [Candidatus Frackibacter sp. WG13]